jgi:hypothetical protein
VGQSIGVGTNKVGTPALVFGASNWSYLAYIKRAF